MTTLDELEEIKELVNNDKNFKYKNIVNFNCESIEKSLKALDIIKNKPFESANCINYITINKNNSNMLDYKHYCMTVKDTLQEEDFNTLKEVLE